MVLEQSHGSMLGLKNYESLAQMPRTNHSTCINELLQKKENYHIFFLGAFKFWSLV